MSLSCFLIVKQEVNKTCSIQKWNLTNIELFWNKLYQEAHHLKKKSVDFVQSWVLGDWYIFLDQNFNLQSKPEDLEITPEAFISQRNDALKNAPNIMLLLEMLAV